MRIHLLLLIAIFSVKTFAQKNRLSDDSSEIKWAKAIINIEAIPSNINQILRNNQDLVENKIDLKTEQRRFDSLIANMYMKATAGTAIFLEYNENYYILTARHVLSDTTNGDNSMMCTRIILIENDTNFYKELSTMKVDINGNLDSKSPEAMLMNCHDNVFSSVHDDLAIINLNKDSQVKNFAKALIKRKYKPVKISDVDTLCRLKVGQKIFEYGFPVESQIYRENVPWELALWGAWTISLPIISKGSVNKIMQDSTFFEAEIFSYHGFSGGPVVSNNKLVGIVSRFLNEPRYNKAGLPTYFLNHQYFVKSSLIMPLIRESNKL